MEKSLYQRLLQALPPDECLEHVVLAPVNQRAGDERRFQAHLMGDLRRGKVRELRIIATAYAPLKSGVRDVMVSGRMLKNAIRNLGGYQEVGVKLENSIEKMRISVEVEPFLGPYFFPVSCCKVKASDLANLYAARTVLKMLKIPFEEVRGQISCSWQWYNPVTAYRLADVYEWGIYRGADVQVSASQLDRELHFSETLLWDYRVQRFEMVQRERLRGIGLKFREMVNERSCAGLERFLRAQLLMPSRDWQVQKVLLRQDDSVHKL